MEKHEIVRPNPYRREFEVEGITNENDDEIILFCDFACFGGRVIRGNNGRAYVTCYID